MFQKIKNKIQYNFIKVKNRVLTSFRPSSGFRILC